MHVQTLYVGKHQVSYKPHIYPMHTSWKSNSLSYSVSWLGTAYNPFV